MPDGGNRQTANLAAAFEGLADGVSTLVQKHLELARHELRRDAKGAAARLMRLMLVFAIALMGYLLLNVAAIAIGGWLGGQAGLALTALGLAVFNLIVAGVMLNALQRESDGKLFSLDKTSDELNKDREWLRQIGETETDQTQAKLS